MGQIVRYELSSGKSFRAFIPDNVTDDTSVLYYSYVVGQKYESDKIWQGYEEDLLAQNPNSIVIIPEDQSLVVGGSNVSTHKYQNNAMEAIEVLENEYNVELNQVVNGGFSAGFGFAVRTSAHYIEATGTTDRQVLVAVDGVMNDSTCIQKSELQTLADNNTLIVSYSQPQNFDYQARKLSSTGLGILYVVDPTLPEQSGDKYWGYHDYMTINFIESGLYQQIIDFVNGKGELPEGYSYRYYDPNTGKIIEITAENAADILGIEATPSNISFDKILETLTDFTIKADNKVFEQHLNKIKNEILSSSILSASLSYSGAASTTDVPSSISPVLDNYYSSTAELLTKLTNDILQFSKISDKVNELNQEQAAEAENLNNLVDNTTINKTNNYYGSNTSTNNTTNNWSNQTQNSSSTSSASNYSGSSNTSGASSSTTYYGGYTWSTGNKSNKPTIQTQTTIEDTTNIDILTDFPEYDTLSTDEDKIVLEYLSETDDTKYKVIIHKDGNTITGIEHYYDFDTTTKATAQLNILKEQYIGNEYFDQIIQNENYLKVTFKEEMYQNMTIDKFIEEYYSELDKVVTEEV